MLVSLSGSKGHIGFVRTPRASGKAWVEIAAAGEKKRCAFLCGDEPLSDRQAASKRCSKRGNLGLLR